MTWADAIRRFAGIVVLGHALTTAGVAQSEVELTVIVETSSLIEAWDWLSEVTVPEFERQNPGTRVRLIDASGAAAEQDKVKFMLAGGLPLDVIRIDVAEFGAFLADDALIDLEPWFADDPTWNANDYHPAAVDALRDRRGRRFGLPSTFTPYVMYYNKSLLARAGLAPPRPDWTWDEFRACCLRLTEDRDGDGLTDTYGVSLTQWLQAVVPWIWQAGGDLIDAAGSAAPFTSPETVAALEFLQRLLHVDRVGSFDAAFANQLSQGLFQAGRAAFYGPVGYWETFRFKNLTAFEWDVVPLPRRAHAATTMAMQGYVVPRGARHPELSYRFIRALTSRDFQGLLARIGNGVPGHVEASLSADFLKPGVLPASEHVFLDVLPTARFMPTWVNWRRIESICHADLEAILLRPGTDVALVCERMRRKTEAFLADEVGRRDLPRLPSGLLPLASLGSALLAATILALSLWRRPLVSWHRDEVTAWVMLAPWLVGVIVLLLVPAAWSAVMVFCEWSPLRPVDDVRFSGLDNVRRMVTSGTFRVSLRATAVYTILSVPAGMVLALAVALLVRRASTLNGVVRTLVYLPSIFSPVVAAIVWRRLLDADTGVVNGLLESVGVAGPQWLRSPTWVVPAFAITGLWTVGSQMLVFVAGLQTAAAGPEDAARIDGAGWWRRLWHVTLPALRPMLLFNGIVSTVTAFQVFALAYAMTQGGPGDSSRFLVLHLYESGFIHLDMGYACAVAWTVFLALFLVCVLTRHATRHLLVGVGGADA